jgi:hypothetical protein
MAVWNCKTSRGGPQTSRLSHFLNSWHTDGVEPGALCPQADSWYPLQFGAESTPGQSTTARIKSTDRSTKLIGNGTRDLPERSNYCSTIKSNKIYILHLQGQTIEEFKADGKQRDIGKHLLDYTAKLTVAFRFWTWYIALVCVYVCMCIFPSYVWYMWACVRIVVCYMWYMWACVRILVCYMWYMWACVRILVCYMWYMRACVRIVVCYMWYMWACVRIVVCYMWYMWACVRIVVCYIWYMRACASVC